MPDYSQGKVYKITGNGKVYVGSTTKTLAHRLSGHCSLFKRGECRSIECLTDPNVSIELLEECCCETKKQLHECERKWIEALECVNKNIPARTVAEWYQDNKEIIIDRQKEYQKINKEKVAEYHRQYHEANKEKHNQVTREYQIVHKEHLKQKAKEYYEANKEKILQRHKEYKAQNKEKRSQQAKERYAKKKELLANNSIPVLETNLSIES